MFKRLVKGTDLQIINYPKVSYANVFNDGKATALIQMKTEKFLFGLFTEKTVEMPKHLKLHQEFDSGKYYIGYDADMKKIVTYSEGKEHLRKLLAEYKKLKNDICAKDFEDDFR
jgi:hypothetical protein